VDCIVTLSTTGIRASNWIPASRSIQGRRFPADCDRTSSHSKCWSGSPVGTRLRRPLSSRNSLGLLEGHAGQFSVLVLEGLGHEVIQDRDAFVLRVFLLPGRRFHFSKPERNDQP